MKKILCILKKSILPIIIVIFLLFLQAKCDLALPDYTSKIVNVGIQQGGINSVVLEVIREEEFSHLSIFMTSEEKSIFSDSYFRISKDTLGEKKYSDYLKKYPLLEKENLYILKENYSEELEAILKEAIIYVSMFNVGGEEIERFKMQIVNQLDIEDKNIDIYTLFSYIDDSTLKQILKSFEEKINSMPESIIEQTGYSYVKNEYNEIGINLEKKQVDYLVNVGIKMLLLAFIIMCITIMVTFLSARIASKFAYDLRRKVVHKVMNFSSKEFDELSQASLITRSTNDIGQVQILIIMLLRTLIYAPILGLGAISKVRGSSMSWVIALAVGVILGLVLTLFLFALPKFQRVQKLIDKLNLVSREILTGLPVIRAFKTEKFERNRFKDANMNLMKTNLFVNRLMSILMPTMMFVMNGVSILIIWVGAKKVDLGTLQVGDLMAFITYTMQIIMSFLMISMVSIMLPRAWISLKRIAEVLNKEVSVKNNEKTISIRRKKIKEIEFRDVYFRYPDAEEDILSNISFKTKIGTTTAFIGSTGSGKSTLINLIPRFFDVTGGKILVDGIDIRNIKLQELRDKIGYVPQKGMLFSGTIKSNILFGNKNYNENDMKNAAKISQSEEFILEKEDKYNSGISQGGTNVSGGQKQRLSIARAIASNPEVYIFDDSFSALDYKTDHKLRSALAKVTKDSIIFIVAQRISTILHADQIVVLDQGKIVGIGDHDELMKNCSVYQEIALSQLSKEELEHE